MSSWIAGWAKVAGKSAEQPAANGQNQALLRQSRQLVLLGILLQCLHILYGVTAVIGVLITQTRIRSSYDTIYHSHLSWQFVTFWVAFAGYAAGLYFWTTHSNPWIAIATLAFVIYRLAVSIIAWKQHRAISRWL